MSEQFEEVKNSLDLNWPLIGCFEDDLYPFNGYDHIRYTARAIMINSQGKYGFLHIQGEDYFGKRDHLESCGGGMEENETLDQTIVREIKEECGLQVKDISLLGSVLDSYNLINRITLSTFFLVIVDDENIADIHRTEEEEILIKDLLWLSEEEVLEWLINKNENPCDILVQRRDLAAFRYYLDLLQQAKREYLK